MIELGVDTGGTHVDLILKGTGPRPVLHKLAVLRGREADATVRGTAELCELAGIRPSQIDVIVHGTTVATNALLEYKGAVTGLVTTKGFRDILHIGRHQRPQNFSMMQDIVQQKWPLVRRRHRLGVTERIAPPGIVVTPLDEQEVREAASSLGAQGVESIAVCFLFSFLNPAHERRAGEIVREELPGVEVSLSSEVIAQFREYERFTTTAANAFLRPKTRGYLEELRDGWRSLGVGGPIYVMQSNGGLATVDEACARPVRLLLSGPAAGVIAASSLGSALDFSHLISLDIGGTSADIAVIPGKLLEQNMQDSIVGGYPILSPKLDVTSIGAGGGSVAWIDEGGRFNVGPRSAGSVPGPACYANGGTEAAVTDAHVVLGRMDPDAFLGGRRHLDRSLALEAVTRIGERFGMSARDAAVAILRIVNANMVKEIRQHSIRRGYDPRRCALVPFGGAGPLHGCEIAEEFDIPAILYPPAPGITSAGGLLESDLRTDIVRTVGVPLDAGDWPALIAMYEELEAELRQRLDVTMDAFGPIELRRQMLCRYIGQGFELVIDIDGIDGAAGWQAEVRRRFEEAHAHEYGFHFGSDPVEIVGVRAVGTKRRLSGQTGHIDQGASARAATPVAERTTELTLVEKDGAVSVQVPVYERERLAVGATVEGPALITEMDSTIVLGRHWTGTVAADSTIVATRKEGVAA